MKKLLSIAIALVMTASIASAQSSSGSTILKSTPTHVPTDTLANAGTKTQSAKISVINSKVGIQVNLTTISGTPAGVIRLLGSMDGVRFKRILPGDSLVVNVNNLTKHFIVTDPLYTDYQVQFIGTGTQSTKINSQAVYRKE